MTTTITPTTTPVPVKTDAQTWVAFGEAIRNASEAEASRLMTEVPTPPLTAERGSSDWMNEWGAQRDAADKRSTLLTRFNSKLIVAIGKALASELPAFRSFDISYEGSGDSGESCSFSVYLDRPALTNPDGSRRYYTSEENKEFCARQDYALSLLPDELTEWLDETAWAIAYNEHPGFEIDAGGYGTLVVERADEDDESSPLQLTISHTERVEQSYEDEVLA